MHYVYLLKSKITGNFYIGSTMDLRTRFTQHNLGKNKSTKTGIPWDLVYYEAYKVKTDALNRERKLKHHGKGLAELKRRLTLDEG